MRTCSEVLQGEHVGIRKKETGEGIPNMAI